MNLISMVEDKTFGYLLLDSSLRVLSFDKTFHDFYSLTLGINLEGGVQLNSLLSDDKKDVILNNFKTVAVTKCPVLYNTQYNKDELIYYFAVTISPVLGIDNLHGYSVSVVDISEQKRQEAERQYIIKDLMQRNRGLEQFVYIVSHNLRSPVAIILGFLDLMESAKNKSEREKLMIGLKKSATNLYGVLTDLDDILQTRIDAGEQKTSVDFVDLIEQIKELLSPLIREKKVQINYNFNEIKLINSVKSYIHNIFYNLITNSIKYSNQNVPPIIDIWSEKTGNNVVLHFRDNGIGIDLEKYGNQLFGLYKRFNYSTEGKGIGLFMIKTQVEAMGGTITVNSSLGRGAHFIITLKAN